uniref:GIY-YIG nuclease family protein n=1 Tax=Microbacterium proteolyticum TaxID=1572644 RepID=UPI0024171166|nr:GIY-YIG nuclease family protein [Microbacterium proteolyticum]
MPTDVYHVCDEQHRLLYVGMSANVFKRMREHKKYAGWWPIAYDGYVIQYATREQATAEEARAIRDGRPIFNRRSEAFRADGPEGEITEYLEIFWRDGEVYVDAENSNH